MTKPFQLGDLVETADGLGTVKEISLTFTKLETPDGLWLMTPNSVLSSGKITNYTGPRPPTRGDPRGARRMTRR